MPVVTVVSLVALALGLVNIRTGESASGSTGNARVITVALSSQGRAIPTGFLGLSLEYSSVKAYAGSDPAHTNPVFVQLIRNLTPGQRPVLRIGGDSTDWTWWPVPGFARPAGVTYTLDTNWIGVTRALARALGARLILSLNLEADSPALAAAEAQALTDGVGAGSVLAFELGNEPELYGTFPWYRTPEGGKVPGRPRDYGFAAFMHDFTTFSGALPGVVLAGPSTGGSGWMGYLRQFLSAEPQVKLVTLHRYPLQLCFTAPRSLRYPTIGRLLSSKASAGLADSFAPSIAVAHAHGLPVRIDELNTVSCGAFPAVSGTFASALWAVDTLFELARVGVDGVNVHTFPGAGYELFRFNHANGGWYGSVSPEYYGLLMFAKSTPPGSRLLAISGETGSRLKAWATATPDGRVRVVLINKDLAHAQVVAVRAPAAAGTATMQLLAAPSVKASTGATLGGQSIGTRSVTGTLQGTPRMIAVTQDRGNYTVTLPAASGALLTFRGPRR
ncbi:MAG: glycosyl hydrolase family 79 C-terminal domain-containing protein [Solirubrobacteraceae bacterium]